MSVEDQHEWLEARRVTLMAHMELALAAHDAVPQGLLDEWYRLQRARDTLLRHRICRVSRRARRPRRRPGPLALLCNHMSCPPAA